MKLTALLAACAALSVSVPAFAEEEDPARCAQLRQQLRSIDSMARQRSTPQLTESRRKVKSEMWDLRCEEMEPKK